MMAFSVKLASIKRADEFRYKLLRVGPNCESRPELFDSLPDGWGAREILRPARLNHDVCVLIYHPQFPSVESLDDAPVFDPAHPFA